MGLDESLKHQTALMRLKPEHYCARGVLLDQASVGCLSIGSWGGSFLFWIGVSFGASIRNRTR
jgi:hypothetical protein